jgi:hypothetical protein
MRASSRQPNDGQRRRAGGALAASLACLAAGALVGGTCAVALEATTSPTAGAVTAVPAKLAFTAFPPAALWAGTSTFDVSVAVEAQTGTVVGTDPGSVALSAASGPGTLSCAGSVPFSDGVASFVGCSVSEAGTYTLRATDQDDPVSATTLTVTSGPVDAVVPSSTVSLVFTAGPTPGTVAAGQPFGVAVSLEYDGKVLDASDAISVSFDSPYPTTATVSCAGGTTQTASAGVAAFSCETSTAGEFELQATDATNPSISPGYSTYVDVNPGAPHALAFTPEPPGSSLGASFPVTVSAVDASGNPVFTDSTGTVALTLVTGPGSSGATLRCTSGGQATTTAPLTFGSATFSCSVSGAGVGDTLVATNPGGSLLPATSTPFDVGQESATIAIAPNPAVVVNDDSASFHVSVTVTGSTGQPVPGHTVTLGGLTEAEVTPNPGVTGTTGEVSLRVVCFYPYCTTPGMQSLAIVVTDASTDTVLGTATERVEELGVPTEGSVGQGETLSVAGGLADEPVGISFGATATSTFVAATTAGTCTTDAGGALSYGTCTFTVPAVPGVALPATVLERVTLGSGPSAASATTSFFMEGAPAINLTPASGQAGSTVTINGSGLGRGGEQTFSFTPPGAVKATATVSCDVDGTGAVVNTTFRDEHCTLVIPPATSQGMGTVTDETVPSASTSFDVVEPCATDPSQDGCAITELRIEAPSQLYTETTYGLNIMATYGDGSSGQVRAPIGPSGPQASFVTAPTPATAITLLGVATTGGVGDAVELRTGGVSTSAPGLLQVSYGGFTATVSLSVVVEPSCGVPGKPECIPVNGALLTVSAQIPGFLGASTPVPGVMVDITQPAGFVVGGPCGPGSFANIGCTPVSTFQGEAPHTVLLSSSTCTTGDNGATGSNPGKCQVTDGATLDQPDVVTIVPPTGYTVTKVSWSGGSCGSGPVTACSITPQGFTPTTVTFTLEPYPVVTVKVSGPVVSGLAGGTADVNAAPNGQKVTVQLLDMQGTPVRTPYQCTLSGGVNGTSLLGIGGPPTASCGLQLEPGSYEVSIPEKWRTPTDPTNTIYVRGAGSWSQRVTLSPGQNKTLSTLSTSFTPDFTVKVNGPVLHFRTPFWYTTFLNAVPNGQKVTVQPLNAHGTAVGSPSRCTLTGGIDGTAPFGILGPAQASCGVQLDPGSYEVSIPAQWSTTGFPGKVAYVSGAAATQVTVGRGSSPSVGFTTSWSALQGVETGTGSASTGGGNLTATGTGGNGQVTVGEYTADPEAEPSFAAGDQYFDVLVSPGNSFTSLSITECGVSTGDELWWWNPVATAGQGDWQQVQGLSFYGDGCLTVVIDATSTPSLAELTGTVFAVALAAPAAPANLRETAQTHTSASLAWTAPASTGGTPVTHYLVYETGNLATTLGATTFAGTVAGLSATSTYHFTVVAENHVGPSTPSATVTVVTTGAGTAPVFTSTSTVLLTVGKKAHVVVSATGTPAPVLSEKGSLPPGLQFRRTSPGKALIAGSPAAGSGGRYHVVVRARNPFGRRVQHLLVVVEQRPAFTSKTSATFRRNVFDTYEITTSGYPAAVITESGPLPDRVHFVAHKNGRATLWGAPLTYRTTVYKLTLTATNGVGNPVRETFRLTIP